MAAWVIHHHHKLNLLDLEIIDSSLFTSIYLPKKHYEPYP